MKDTLRTTLLQFKGTLRAKNASEEKIRWMLEGAITAQGMKSDFCNEENRYQRLSISKFTRLFKTSYKSRSINRVSVFPQESSILLDNGGYFTRAQEKGKTVVYVGFSHRISRVLAD